MQILTDNVQLAAKPTGLRASKQALLNYRADVKLTLSTPTNATTNVPQKNRLDGNDSHTAEAGFSFQRLAIVSTWYSELSMS